VPESHCTGDVICAVGTVGQLRFMLQEGSVNGSVFKDLLTKGILCVDHNIDRPCFQQI
jgi:hypothetical protein